MHAARKNGVEMRKIRGEKKSFEIKTQKREIRSHCSPAGALAEAGSGETRGETRGEIRNSERDSGRIRRVVLRVASVVAIVAKKK